MGPARGSHTQRLRRSRQQQAAACSRHAARFFPNKNSFRKGVSYPTGIKKWEIAKLPHRAMTEFQYTSSI
eukprot:COSAG01_NODE_1840_length_9078_cov_149.015481_5_plen_70_part_00